MLLRLLLLLLLLWEICLHHRPLLLLLLCHGLRLWRLLCQGWRREAVAPSDLGVGGVQVQWGGCRTLVFILFWRRPLEAPSN